MVFAIDKNAPEFNKFIIDEIPAIVVVY